MIKISIRDLFADLPPSILKKKLKKRDDEILHWKEINTQEEFDKISGNLILPSMPNSNSGIYKGDQLFFDNEKIEFWPNTTIGFQYHPSIAKGGKYYYFYSPKYKCLLMIRPSILEKHSKEYLLKRATEIVSNEPKYGINYEYKND